MKAPTLLGVMADPTGKPDLLFLVRTDLGVPPIADASLVIVAGIPL